LTGLASLLGIPPGLLTGVPTATSPVTVSSLGPPSLNPSVISQLNSSLQGLAALAGLQGLGPTSGGVAPGVGGAAVAGGTPTGLDFGPAAANAPNISTASLAAPNAPSVAQAVAPSVEGAAADPAATQGLGPAAQTAQTQTNAETQAPSPPSTVSTPVTTAPSSPSSPMGDMGGGILQLVMSLLTGYPPLDNLAQNARFG
jgi:hypothetical protein